jgi:hypothetical protein
MKFAIVNGSRTEAAKGGTGVCPSCGSPLVAKCGQVKVHHWAHKGTRSCDPWWENETDWHRAWKNQFPQEWQETTLHDERTGEKHIADVRSTNGLVIEFQHSHLNPTERTSRELFYRNLVWVVDGTRLKRDYPRFLKGQRDFRSIAQGVYAVSFPEESFPADWIGSTAPVVFDFRGTEKLEDPNDLRNQLYCLFPKANHGPLILAVMSLPVFVNLAQSRASFMTLLQPQPMPNPVPQQQPNAFRRREPEYFLERGRWKRRRRF